MSDESSLGHLPAKTRWEFDASVAEVFDDMLRRSIPQYDVMRELVWEVGRKYVRPSTDIVDLGSSRGEAVDRFVRGFGAHNRFHLIEVSPPMLEVLRQRYAGYIDAQQGPKGAVVTVRDLDLREEYPNVQASLTLAVLTLQFTPIEYRQRIVQRVYNNTAEGGAFIVVEKLIGGCAATDEHFENIYLDLKRANGYSEDEIRRKKFALEGVLVPTTAKQNEDFLRAAGFRHVECFWRWSNFAAWVAIK